MELRKSIRFHYGVDPIHLEPLTDQTYTFMSGSNKFILKKSTLNENQLPLWERVFHIANQENLSSILPVYLTNTSEMYMMHDGHIFYLSPYMDSKPIQVKDFYQKLGHIHRKTKTEYTINPIEIKRSFQDYQKKCKENKKILLSYVEYFEQQQHMSPLALQVCTHYRDLQRIFEILDHKVAEMLREREEKVTWSTSLCHGNLSFSHLLFKQNLYFFNWEKASFQNAIQDLYQFFQKETDAYDAPIDDFIHQFEFYLEENELSKDECILLSIYLLDPQPYLNEVQYFIKDPQNFSMMRQTKKLQRSFRKLMFAGKFVEELDMHLSLFDLEDGEVD